MQPDEAELERALQAAASDPSSRPDFYARLLAATVYVISPPNAGGAGARTMEAGEEMPLVTWAKADGSPIIPFFSSLDMLQGALTEESGYLALPARSLFEITAGASLVLNPRSEYGKEFFPEEIEALLTDGVNHRADTRVVEKATEVLLGQPSHYPAAMVEALAALLGKRANAKAGYLAMMHDPSQDPRPHLVIGVEADDGVEQLIKEAGSLVADLSPPDEPVDLVAVVKGSGGLSDYFVGEVKPFYKRAGGGLKGLFGFR